jgi:hypothetical protein
MKNSVPCRNLREPRVGGILWLLQRSHIEKKITPKTVQKHAYGTSRRLKNLYERPSLMMVLGGAVNSAPRLSHQFNSTRGEIGEGHTDNPGRHVTRPALLSIPTPSARGLFMVVPWDHRAHAAWRYPYTGTATAGND